MQTKKDQIPVQIIDDLLDEDSDEYQMRRISASQKKNLVGKGLRIAGCFASKNRFGKEIITL